MADLASAYAIAGRADEARRLLGRLARPLDIARVHAALGEEDQALAFLEEALAARDGSVVWINLSLYFEPLRSDPRFQALLRRMGFPGLTP